VTEGLPINAALFKSLRSVALAAATLAGMLGATIAPEAQEFKDLQSLKSPLVLKAQGSFYVGGDVVEQTRNELGSFGPGGRITINQMYVRYMIPQGGDRKAAVVLIHGSTLTGKSWETTPDGRMGWDEYLARKGHAVRPRPGRPRALRLQPGALQRRPRGGSPAGRSALNLALQ